MKRLRRRGVRAPADWQATVDARLPDAKAFWKAAKAFEGLVVDGKKRRMGFAAYAPHVLVLDSKGKADFPPVWGDKRCRQAIAGMSGGLCAYCETMVSSNHPGKGGKERPPGQIEHLRPKSLFPTLTYRWINYFFGCMGCNGAKHDKWAAGGYVRPDRGEPGGRFVFHRDGSVSARRKGDRQASNTIDDMDLKRDWLNIHRAVAIESHLDFVRNQMGPHGLPLDKLLIKRAVAFSVAINQNVRRVWEGEQKKKKKP